MTGKMHDFCSAYFHRFDGRRRKGESMQVDKEQIARVRADYRTGQLTAVMQHHHGEEIREEALGPFDTSFPPAGLVNWILLHVRPGVEIDIFGPDGRRIIP